MSTHQPRKVEIKVDRYTRFCLTAIAVLLTILILGLWMQAVPTPPSASAGELFNDSAAQRSAIVDEAKATNSKLDELISLLKSGDIKVQVQGGEKDGTNGAKK
jgi:hypothetical protein